MINKNNKRWYAAWEGNFPAGSPEGAALSQIDTGSPTPPPTALEIVAPISLINATTVQLNYAAGGAEHATQLHLQWHIAGAPELGKLRARGAALAGGQRPIL